MYKLGTIVMYSADDIVEALHVSKETAYKLFTHPQAKVAELGRKKLMSQEALQTLLNSKIKV